MIELDQSRVRLLGKPIPASETEPIPREEQNRNMAEFLAKLAEESDIPAENAVCISGNSVMTGTKKATDGKIRSTKLLTKDIRKKLPSLLSQDGRGGKAVAHVKFFTPDANWTWWATEGEPIKDEKGNEVVFHFFGLVEGHCKELGHFSLRELESVRGPMGLPIERDLHWQPKTLGEIAPEMFQCTGKGCGEHEA